MSHPNAFVTLLTTPSYLPGALVLLHSLLDLHPAPRDFKIICLVTPETVDARTIGELRKAGFDLVIGVEPIGSGTPGRAGLDLMGRPDLSFALTKLHLFRLHLLFSTLIYLDADVLPIRPLSHLFITTAPHVLSACPDTGWPDCFNSGVMVVRPRESDWKGLRELLKNGEGEGGLYEAGGNGSFDGADQGLLNEWFSEEGGGGDWKRLPFLYNVTPTAAYQYAPAYRRYGQKINAVHFIGSNKPWFNLAGRPAGMSYAKGKDASFDYPSLIDRWYAVYDRHIRPTAAHHPDLAQRFAVPETKAVWNQSNVASGVPPQPDDRLDLNDLKGAVERGVTSLKSGQYISLPLDGRVDLMMPKPKPKLASLPPPYASPTAMASPALSGPPPQTFQQQTTRPATWDASRYSPPPSGGPEMSIPIDKNYTPAWDQPTSTQSAYHSSQHAEPEYPNIPANVLSDDWYKGYTGSTPDRKNVQAVFPWEQREGRRPDRIFPPGDSPPLSTNRRANLSISVREATPPIPSPPRETPPKTMQEAISGYTNAWDKLPSIQRYVNTMSGSGTQSTKRERDVLGLQSVPGTPKYESSSKRDLSIDRRSDISGDGDDEDEDEETIETNSSPSVVHSRDGTFDLPLDLPTSARYRGFQPDPPQAIPQAQPRVTRNSSSETARPTSASLVTPPSDPRPLAAPAQYTSDSPGPKTSRIWDPNTDVNVRKRDTQNVLSRFMQVGGFQGGGKEK